MVSGAATAGDATSASQLTTYADALLPTSQAFNGTGAAYAADFNQVLDSLQGVTGNVDTLTQSFIAKDTQNQTDQLKQSLDDLGTGLGTKIAALRREMQGQTRLMAMAS